MTNKEKVWVALAVVVSGVTSYSVAEYRKEPTAIVPAAPVVAELPEFKGDRAGTVMAIEGSNLRIELKPILGQLPEVMLIDTTKVELIVLVPPSGTGKNPTYAGEVSASIDQFEVGDPVQLRYDTDVPPKIIQLVRTVVPQAYYQ